MHRLLGFVLVSFVSGCGGSATVNLNSGQSVDLDTVTTTASADDLEGSPGSSALGDTRLQEGVCDGVDTTPVYSRLGASSFTELLSDQNLSYSIERQRPDLIYVDVRDGDATVRFRVATLSSPEEAARDLHEALLEHGKGSWGVHRSNLAVLGPIASTDDAIAFAARTKLACWGVLTVTGRDDTYVVPGAYTSL